MKYFLRIGILSLIFTSSCVTAKAAIDDEFDISSYQLFTVEGIGAQNALNVIPNCTYDIVHLIEDENIRYVDLNSENHKDTLIVRYTIRRSIMTGSEVTIQVLSPKYKHVEYSVVGKSRIGVPSADIPKAAKAALEQFKLDLTRMKEDK